MKKASYIMVGVCFVILIAVLFIRGCSIQKVDTSTKQTTEVTSNANGTTSVNSQNNSTGNVSSQGSYVSDTTGSTDATAQSETTKGKQVEVLENSGYDVSSDILEKETDSSITQKSAETEGTSNVSEDGEENSDFSLKLVNSVAIEDKYSSDVLVSSKNVYLVGDSVYAYSLKLILPIDGEGYRVVDYLCSVTTWNSVESGDSLRVEYGLDAEKKVLILSISKIGE
jgi:hypothetical protein